MDKKILRNFSIASPVSAIKTFFSELNIPLVGSEENPFEFRDLEPFSNYYKEDNEAHNLINDIYFGGTVDDSAFSTGTSTTFDDIKSQKEKYDGLLVFVVTVKERENGNAPTRGQLAEITRFLNRSSYYLPVAVLFEYKESGKPKISLANSARQEFKQEWRDGEKVGKVSILHDIDVENPHTGHIKILDGMAIKQSGTKAITTFEALYEHWQAVFSVSLLNKSFYRDLSNWYFWAIKDVKFPNTPTKEEAHLAKKDLDEMMQEHKGKNVIRLLTRLLFVWFIKE